VSCVHLRFILWMSYFIHFYHKYLQRYVEYRPAFSLGVEAQLPVATRRATCIWKFWLPDRGWRSPNSAVSWSGVQTFSLTAGQSAHGSKPSNVGKQPWVFTVTKAYRQPDTNVRLNQNKIIYVKAAFFGLFLRFSYCFFCFDLWRWSTSIMEMSGMPAFRPSTDSRNCDVHFT
jgi:hypothetical protein